MAKSRKKRYTFGLGVAIYFLTFICLAFFFVSLSLLLFPYEEYPPDWYIASISYFSLIAPFFVTLYTKKKMQNCFQKNSDSSEKIVVEMPYQTFVEAYNELSVSKKSVPYKPVSVFSQLNNIDLMEGHDFEYWCADLLRKNGFTQVEVTRGSGDQGVDILAQKDGIRYAIQCKNYSSDLGNKPVQEIHAGKMIYHCHIGAVMTNRYFTAGGKEAAAATGVLLWDRDWIANHMPKTQSETPAVSAPSYRKSYLHRDELFSFAVEEVLKMGRPDPHALQRKLSIGFARAARIIDEMEEEGIIGPFRGSTPRDILITPEQWYSGTYKK